MEKKTRHSIAFWILLSLLTLFVLSIGGFFLAMRIILGSDTELQTSLLENQAQTLLIYDGSDTLTAEYSAAENRIPIPLSDVPAHVREAFLAAEDARFYSHFGLDLIRIAGALKADLLSGTRAQGASTLTQQLVKQTHLTTEKTWTRKIKEAYLALQVERLYTKDEIFEMYLNLMYFGAGAYGIEAASQTYFSKTVSELTLSEGALLAGIMKGTTKYAPHLNPEDSVERRNLVLFMMEERGYITEEEKISAQAEALRLHMQSRENPHGWYMDAVLDEAASVLDIADTELLSSGYRIYTALDADLQSACEAAYADATLFPEDAQDGTPVQSAVCAIDVNTGLVSALIGGRTYDVRRGFNRATQAKRQPGSAIKPLLEYAPAVEYTGLSPATLLLDEPEDFGGYAPASPSGSYWGLVTARTALAHSLNLPAVRLLRDTGIDRCITFAESLGLTFTADDRHLAIALGGMAEGLTAVEITSAYACLASGGFYREPSLIRKITDSQGKTLYEASAAPMRVMKEATAYLVTDMLQSTVSTGTAVKLQAVPCAVAAKTGTVAYEKGGVRDAWLCAYTPDVALTVWMGYDRTDETHHLPKGESGGDAPATVATAILSMYVMRHPQTDFIQPAGVVAVELDLASLQEGALRLASATTPANQRWTEIFATGTQPTETTAYWDPPQTPPDFTVTIESGLPQIRFTALANEAVYLLYRRENGSEELLTSFRGWTGSISWTDESALPGHTYTYTLLPIRYDITDAAGGSVTGQYTFPQTVFVPFQTQDINPDFWSGLSRWFGSVFSH